MYHYCSPFPRVIAERRVQALRRCSGGRGRTGEKKDRLCVFLKMSYNPCISGCGRFLAPQDGHDHCLTCLGIQHAEEAFVDGSCSSCGDMTISELRNRLRYVKHGGVPLPLPRSSVRPGTRGGIAPFGCGNVVRARPRDDGYAFPGHRECRAHVESSTASRSFEAGRVVSRWGLRWFSVLIEPVGRRLLPSTPWRYCRSTRPKP